MSTQYRLFLSADDVLVLVLFEFSISDLSQRLYYVLCDVFLCDVAVIVYKNLQHQRSMKYLLIIMNIV